MAERTYQISAIDGRNKRAVTLAQFMAEHKAAVAKVKPVANAFYRGDISGCAKAQQAARK